MQNTLIYLIGFPGVGKYTIAQAIARQADVVVVDNQLVNMPIFALFKPDGKTRLPAAMWQKIERVWELVFETMVELVDPADNFVLTNVLLESAADRAWFAKVTQVAKRRGAELLPVRLLCEEAENLRRVASPGRQNRLKLVDPDELAALRRRREVLMPDHRNTFTLDVTERSPEEAALRILEAAKRLPGGSNR